MPRCLDRVLAELVDAQSGVLSRAQLREAGVTRHLVRNQVAARRWQRLGPRVVATFTGTLTAEQLRTAVLLHAGPTAALAGLSAAEAHGLTGWAPDRVHLLMPHGRRIPPLDGVLTRTTRGPVHRDIAGRSPIQVALWDAASWARTDAAAAGLLAAGVQQRLLTANRLASADDRPRHRRALLRAVCADLVGGAQALSEIRFGPLARRAGLPPPVRQSRRRDAAGRYRYLDADFGAFAVEIDGMPHLGATAHAQDLLRHNDLVLSDVRLLRFAAWTVRGDKDLVVGQLRRAADRWL